MLNLFIFSIGWLFVFRIVQAGFTADAYLYRDKEKPWLWFLTLIGAFSLLPLLLASSRAAISIIGFSRGFDVWMAAIIGALLFLCFTAAFEYLALQRLFGVERKKISGMKEQPGSVPAQTS